MKKILSFLIIAALLAAALCGCGEMVPVPSGSDIPGVVEVPVVWDMAASDEEYLEMMREKLDEYIVCMTTLSAMENRLAKLGDEQKITGDKEFSALAEQLYDWSEGALGYPADMLITDEAKTVCSQLQELAGATVVYLDNLPSMLVGTYTGEVSMDDYKNSIADSAVTVFEALNQ